MLFILVSFVTVTAVPSGLILIAVPDGSTLKLSAELLDQTPFKDFRIPGILLAILVGGTNLIALFFQIKKSKSQTNWSIAGGILLCGWIIIQMILTGNFHWLQALYLFFGIFIILIAYQLKGKWIV